MKKKTIFVGTFEGRLPTLPKALVFQAHHWRSSGDEAAARLIAEEIPIGTWLQITVEEVAG
jgi:hypothetical protein